MNIITRKRKFSYQEQEAQNFLRKFKRQQQQAIWNFVQNPGVGPIPTPAAWIYSLFQQVGTLNGTTAVTGLVTGTGMLAVGQVVTGTNIVNNPPTTIAAIGSNTALTLSQAASGSGSPTLTFQGVPGMQAPVFSQYPFYAIPSPTATDIPGCAWAIPETQALNAGSTFIPSNGVGLIALVSGTTAMTVQFQTASGTWTSFYPGTASSTIYTPLLMADAVNLRVNCPTTAGSFIFYRLRAATWY